MKGIPWLISVLLLSLVVAACGGNESEKSQEDDQKSDEAEASSADNESVKVDKGLLNVEVTFPASFFEDEDYSHVEDQAKADGVGEVIKNDDGSVTFKMSKATHQELLTEAEEGINEFIEELKTNAEFESIEDVTANSTYSEFSLVVNQETFENSLDRFAALGLGIQGLYYQLFDGVNPDDYEVTISLESTDTGEVFDTIVFPEALEEMSESLSE